MSRHAHTQPRSFPFPSLLPPGCPRCGGAAGLGLRACAGRPCRHLVDPAASVRLADVRHRDADFARLRGQCDRASRARRTRPQLLRARRLAPGRRVGRHHRQDVAAQGHQRLRRAALRGPALRLPWPSRGQRGALAEGRAGALRLQVLVPGPHPGALRRWRARGGQHVVLEREPRPDLQDLRVPDRSALPGPGLCGHGPDRRAAPPAGRALHPGLARRARPLRVHRVAFERLLQPGRASAADTWC
jgi:hypothetical protein